MYKRVVKFLAYINGNNTMISLKSCNTFACIITGRNLLFSGEGMINYLKMISYGKDARSQTLSSHKIRN